MSVKQQLASAIDELPDSVTLEEAIQRIYRAFKLKQAAQASGGTEPEGETASLRADADGNIRVAGTRVTLDTVIHAFDGGATAEEIVQRYPVLHLADVYAVIGHYLHHPQEIRTYLQRRRREAEAVRTENEARFDPEGIRDRLLARRRQQG